MPIYSRSRREDFIPCPEGMQRAVCCDVVDLGMVLNPKYNREVPQVKLKWQSEHQLPDSRPFVVWKKYTNSTNPKAQLRKDLEAWAGRKLPEDMMAEFDLEILITRNCQLQIMHITYDDGGVFAAVNNIIPVAKDNRTGRPIFPALLIQDYTRETVKQERDRSAQEAIRNAARAADRRTAPVPSDPWDQGGGPPFPEPGEDREMAGGRDDDVPF